MFCGKLLFISHLAWNKGCVWLKYTTQEMNKQKVEYFTTDLKK